MTVKLCFTILLKLPDWANCNGFRKKRQHQPALGVEPISFEYTKTINCSGERIVLDKQALDLLPQIAIYSLLLRVSDKKQGKLILETAVDAVTQILVDKRIISTVSVVRKSVSKGANHYDIIFSICELPPIELLKKFREWGGSGLLYKNHIYKVMVSYGEWEAFCLNCSETIQAISTFDYWRKKEYDHTVVYNDQDKQKTIIDYP